MRIGPGDAKEGEGGGTKTRELSASRYYAAHCLSLRPPNEIAAENLTTLPLNPPLGFTARECSVDLCEFFFRHNVYFSY